MDDVKIIYVNMDAIRKEKEIRKRWINACFDKLTCKPNSYWQPYGLWKANHAEDK